MKQFRLATFLLLVFLLGLICQSVYGQEFPGINLPGVITPLDKQVISLTVVGDVVMHLPIITSCYNSVDHSYDFRPIFAEIKPSLEKADMGSRGFGSAAGGIGIEIYWISGV